MIYSVISQYSVGSVGECIIYVGANPHDQKKLLGRLSDTRTVHYMEALFPHRLRIETLAGILMLGVVDGLKAIHSNKQYSEAAVPYQILFDLTTERPVDNNREAMLPPAILDDYNVFKKEFLGRVRKEAGIPDDN